MQSQNNFKKKRADSLQTIRIRSAHRSINLGEQSFKKEVKVSPSKNIDIEGMLKKIPKTVQIENSLLVQGCFSYVDEGVEKWVIGKTIGKGNSFVKKALNIKNGRIAAVKQVVLGSEEESEIKILKELKHENIVSYLEDHKVKNETWIFMEYINRNLRSFILEYGKLSNSPEVFFHFIHQITRALAELEAKHIIHKDIKCENVLMDNQGTLKLCDFGCSKDFRSTLSLRLYEKHDELKSFKGSYLWTAPECLLGKPCLASDIWSFGCLMIELVSGELPWHEQHFDNQFQAIRHIVESNQAPQICEDLPEKIKQIIRCCLQREPQKRVTAKQLLNRSQFWE